MFAVLITTKKSIMKNSATINSPLISHHSINGMTLEIKEIRPFEFSTRTVNYYVFEFNGNEYEVEEDLITLSAKSIFEEGKVYEMHFIGDSNLKPQYKCTSRTEKTATFERVNGDEFLQRKIRVYNDKEYISAGSYSMAPTIYSDNLAK